MESLPLHSSETTRTCTSIHQASSSLVGHKVMLASPAGRSSLIPTVAGAPMAHGDGEPRGINTPEAGRLQRSRVRLLHLAKIAIQRQMTAASETVAFSQTWADFNWSAPQGPVDSSARVSSSRHGQVGVVDEEELAPLFDVMGGEVSVSVVCMRVRVRLYGCGGMGAWMCSHARLRRV